MNSRAIFEAKVPFHSSHTLRELAANSDLLSPCLHEILLLDRAYLGGLQVPTFLPNLLFLDLLWTNEQAHVCGFARCLVLTSVCKLSHLFLFLHGCTSSPEQQNCGKNRASVHVSFDFSSLSNKVRKDLLIAKKH
jgi:hypothetical protein